MLIGFLVFLPFVFAIADYIIGLKNERARDVFAVIVTFIELILAGCLLYHTVAEMHFEEPSLIALQLPYVFTSPLTFCVDGFRSVYSFITALMWAFTTLFSMEYFRHEREHLNRYYFFVLATLGATQGVMLSGDLMTTFLFFEILSLTSFTWVMHEETKGAIRAGYTYLFIAIIGGLVLFMGLVLLQTSVGTLSFNELPEAVRMASGKHGTILAAGICILFGFGCKAGMFPVHVWLPKAHPVAPSPASALLSGILTKVGIYGILMTALQALTDDLTFGWLILILGTVTMFLGALLALFSVNLKRTLACSSMSQIGFILIGIAMTILLTAAGAEEHAHTALAGTMLHMTNHSLLKLCLFCAAGVVVMNIGQLELNRIRGWGRRKPLIKIAFLLGGLGISGVPLFNGYASKTLLHEAIVEGIKDGMAGGSALQAIEWIFLISGGCTFAYMMKLFFCIFVEKNHDENLQREYDAQKKYMNFGSAAAVFGTSLLFPILGQKAVFNPLESIMTGHQDVLAHFHPLSWECIKGGLVSLCIGAAIYIFFIRGVLMDRKKEYVNRWPEWLDLENLFYRPLLTRWLPGFFGVIFTVFAGNLITKRIANAVMFLFAVFGRALQTGPDALIVLVRRTVMRERIVDGSAERRRNLLINKLDEKQEAYQPIVENFSFALMVACIGMLVIFGVLMFFIL